MVNTDTSVDKKGLTSFPIRDTVPEERCTNLSYIRQLTKDNSVMMIELIEVYLEETAQLVETMKQSIVMKNWELLRFTAHSILPSFTIMGMELLFEEIATEIMELATSLRDKKVNDQVSTPEFTVDNNLFLAIRDVCFKASNELKIELGVLRAI